MCGLLEEITFHVIRQCKMAFEVWLHTQMHEKWSFIDETDVFQWLLKVTEKMDQKSFEFGLIIFGLYGSIII